MPSSRSLFQGLILLLKTPRMALPLGIAAALLAYMAITHPRNTTESAVAARYHQWWNYLHQRQFSRAYAMMAPQYRAEHSEADFYRAFYQAGDDWLRPHSGQKVDAYYFRATIFPRDSFSDGNGGPEYEMLQINGQWYFTGAFKYVYGRRNHLLASN